LTKNIEAPRPPTTRTLRTVVALPGIGAGVGVHREFGHHLTDDEDVGGARVRVARLAGCEVGVLGAQGGGGLTCLRSQDTRLRELDELRQHSENAEAY